MNLKDVKNQLILMDIDNKIRFFKVVPDDGTIRIKIDKKYLYDLFKEDPYKEEIKAYFEEGWHLIVRTENEHFKYLYHEGVIAEQSGKYPVKNGVLEFNVLGAKLLGFGEPN